MNRLFQQKFRRPLNPRDGDPSRVAATQATNIVLVMMLVLLVVGGLAHAFTELFLR
ncbi:hypothetical protein OIU34_09025 [Pararhizobium sp. BT-229]|uniref:hypothetical protein n=1 Tax=Pararhizobium sp. BT-229 TaxID=2986923 RepID=UPI0021F72AE7|nr:hypothetical protein [Pararhizobium sp. BT-229]MCV9962040.1 hypothetical protein [Pararhizobium sp. BT-229]